ncbi:secondary metabolism biosynthetic enzyme [Penicillium lividum]|nr:secondary metabolism biosynthetic enzyme [Penicillium lividum]
MSVTTAQYKYYMAHRDDDLRPDEIAASVCGLTLALNALGARIISRLYSKWRLGLGLPACSIQIGAVDEVGYLAQHESLMQKLKSSGTGDWTLSSRELLEAIEGAMQFSLNIKPLAASKDFCVGPRADRISENSGARSLWKKDIRMAVFNNYEENDNASGSQSSDGLKSFLAAAKGDQALLGQAESSQLLAVEIGKKVFSFLLKPEEDLQTTSPLSDLGIDSLVAIEIRQWWKMTLGFDISVFEIMGVTSLDALGKHAARGLLKLHHGVEVDQRTRSRFINF